MVEVGSSAQFLDDSSRDDGIFTMHALLVGELRSALASRSEIQASFGSRLHFQGAARVAAALGAAAFALMGRALERWSTTAAAIAAAATWRRRLDGAISMAQTVGVRARKS
eukprot:4058976-Pleurochrysis_carterae.AAC.2